MLVACLGDVMLDVIVEPERSLVDDDDIPATITLAPGGQAANVATWVAALGEQARVFGPRADTAPGQLVEGALRRRGVEVWGVTTGRTGTVVSVVTGGTRTMASDPGDLGWLDGVDAGDWLESAAWLFLSGYSLMRTPEPARLVEVAAVARAQGTRVAVDLSSAALLSRFGGAEFFELCTALRPAVVFGNDAEWSADHGSFGAGGSTVLVLKHGAGGASFVIDGVADVRQPVGGPVVDVTGAGDALAAGFLVGGVELAMHAAARCVAHRGAQPEVGTP